MLVRVGATIPLVWASSGHRRFDFIKMGLRGGKYLPDMSLLAFVAIDPVK